MSEARLTRSVAVSEGCGILGGGGGGGHTPIATLRASLSGTFLPAKDGCRKPVAWSLTPSQFLPSRMGNTDLKSIPLLNQHFSRESLHWVQLMQPANASVRHAVRLWHDRHDTKRFRREITSVKFLISCWRVDCGRGYVVCQCVCVCVGGRGGWT